MRLLVLALLIVSISTNVANAADHHVSPSGSGSACSVELPCSQATGVSAAQPGDTVYFAAGSYATTLTPERAGTPGNVITFRPEGADLSAFLTGGVVVNYGYITIDGFEINRSGYSGVRIDGGATATTSDRDYGRDGVTQTRHYYANGADHVTIRNCYIYNTGDDGIKISRADWVLVENNTIEGPLGTNGQGIDLLASYHPILRGNVIDGTSTPFNHGLFAKGGSEDILVENNIISNIGGSFAAIEIGQDTEYYNTRYTSSLVNPRIHDALLTWTIYNGLEGIWYGYPATPTATGGGANYVEDSTATFNSTVSRVIFPGMHLIKMSGSPLVEACTCTISDVSVTRLDCSDNLHQTAVGSGMSCESFSSGDVYRVRDPMTNAGTYDGDTMAEARNAIVRNNLITNCDPPVSVKNGVNVDVYNNTSINSGMSQGLIKLWNDATPSHVSKNVRVFNNLFYNDGDHQTTRYVYDKQAGTQYPTHTGGWLSDYNLRWDAITTSAGPNGNLPPGNETHSIAQAPIFSTDYQLTSNSPGVSAGYIVPTDANSVFTQDNSGYIYDILGVARDSSPTIGAYEYVSGDPDPINGTCGSSNNGTFSTAPTTNLCTTGTASSVSGTGPWIWTCAGSDGGSTASCSASVAAGGGSNYKWAATGLVSCAGCQ